MSSEDEDISSNLPGSEGEDEGVYSFRRNKNCQYHKVSWFFFFVINLNFLGKPAV